MKDIPSITEKAKPKKRRPKKPKLTTLPEDGLLQYSEFAHFFPVGKSTWWQGVKDGIYPQPVALGPKTKAWKAQDLRLLIDEGTDAFRQGHR